jgi:hypothetical protein
MDTTNPRRQAHPLNYNPSTIRKRQRPTPRRPSRRLLHPSSPCNYSSPPIRGLSPPPLQQSQLPLRTMPHLRHGRPRQMSSLATIPTHLNIRRRP